MFTGSAGSATLVDRTQVGRRWSGLSSGIRHEGRGVLHLGSCVQFGVGNKGTLVKVRERS